MFDAYEIVLEEDLNDINSHGILLRHKKTGARVSVIKNDDINKVFSIAFRTPPVDSTGVAHIIEHTVLNGSEKYPLKDPFVELAKGSLKTFLNAMTYPDKTVYPIASCNDKDFDNLMDVYLNAVFYPNIYKNEKIFRQEGWHYHLEEKDAPLTYNGVVYNEMKGAFSSADAVLERTVFSALFPNSPYGVESGGDPEYIPDLTYEQFLDFHRKYYHPSNSYIYLYGNMDVEEKLAWIDKEYLSKFDKLDIDSTICTQKPFSEPKKITISYPALDEEPIEDNTSLNMSIVTGDGLDLLTATAFSVLEYVLLDAPGAPLKQALLDAKIGKDISGCYNDGIRQHFLSIDAKFANESDTEAFEKTIYQALEKIADEGIDEKALRAAIYYYEFRFREADFSVYPKGLIYGLGAFDTWLYDDMKPYAPLKMLDIYDQLKKLIGTGYYEKLIKENIIANPHKLIVTLVPEHGLASKREAQLAKKLEEYKNSLTDVQIASIVEETKALIEYQSEKDSPEAVACLPMLSREDIDKETPVALKTIENEIDGIKVLRQDYDTRGISYLSIMFDIDDISEDLVKYVGLLKGVLGSVSTQNYNYFELSNEINSRTGGIGFSLQAFTKEDGTCKKYLAVKSKYLDAECDFVLKMISEIIRTSVFDDEKRLYEIISSRKAYLQESIPASGHASAVGRALSHMSETYAWMEDVSGIAYYRFIEDIFGNYEERKPQIIKMFGQLVKHIFNKENMLVSITSGDEGYEQLASHIGAFSKELYDRDEKGDGYKWEKADIKEAFKTSGQVQYVATVGNFRDKGYDYTGTMRILKTILNYGYLWNNIRVKGGAYGCMSGFKRTGDSYLASYRDPHLMNTCRVYEELAGYIKTFDADEKELTKYIIGTISELDTPLNANAKGALALNAYITGLTEADFQQERDEILTAKTDDIRALSALIKDTFDTKHICVIGSEAAIKEHEAVFDKTEALVQG